jgi:hypothetical protein
VLAGDHSPVVLKTVYIGENRGIGTESRSMSSMAILRQLRN